MKTLTTNNIAQAIYLAIKDKGGTSQMDKLHDVTKFLARKKLLGRSKDILDSLKRIISREEGIVTGVVSSVEKLSHKTKEEISHALKKRYKAHEVRLEEEIDETLLGGVRIEVNNELIDLSMKNKIWQLQEHLTKSI